MAAGVSENWYANKCIDRFSNSHLCNGKIAQYGKLYDGEQQVLVFLKVLW